MTCILGCITSITIVFFVWFLLHVIGWLIGYGTWHGLTWLFGPHEKK